MEGEFAGGQIRQLFREVDQHEFDRRLMQTSRGLTVGRIREFEHVRADESMAGEQCIVCLDDLEVGTKMVRLDCHVDHYLCETCAYSWFRHHKTCPTCRHEFSKLKKSEQLLFYFSSGEM